LKTPSYSKTMSNDSDVLTAWEILTELQKEDNEKNEVQGPVKTKSTVFICVGCKSSNMIDDYSSGYKVCGDCGEISDNIYDRGPEWSQFDEGKGCGSMRCGGPTNPYLPIASLGTTIMACATSKIKKLHNWGQMPYDERALKEVLDMIEDVCKKNNVVKAVSDCAQVLFAKLYKIKHPDGKNKGKKIIFRGKNRLSIIAICIYYGAVIQKQTHTTKTIAKYFNLKESKLSDGRKDFLEYMKNDNIIKNIIPPDPTYFIKNFCNKKLPKEYIPIAVELADNVTKLDLASNHQPNSIAAACIYLLVKHCNITFSKKDIISHFGISEPTLNKTVNKLEKWDKVLFDSAIADKLAVIFNKTEDTDNDINLQLAQLNINVITKEPKVKRPKSRKQIDV